MNKKIKYIPEAQNDMILLMEIALVLRIERHRYIRMATLALEKQRLNAFN